MAPLTPAEYAESFLPLAHRLAQRIQWNYEDHEDLVQEGVLALMEAVQKNTAVISNPYGYARKVMHRAMQDFYYRRSRMDEVPVENVECHVELYGEEVFLQQVFYQVFFEELERFKGTMARRVAENLVHPEEAVVRMALYEQAVKAKQKRAGASVRGVESLLVKKEHIWKALNISKSTFAEILNEVRDFTGFWFRAHPTTVAIL